jgi:hypothetical protein
LLTTLACAAVLVGAGAETAFADSGAVGQPVASPPTTSPTSRPSPIPSVEASPTARPTAGSGPAAPPAPTMGDGRQISVVPSGAPNTGVPPVASDGHGQAAAVGASLVALLGGSGTLVLRRRLKGRG